MSQHIGRKNIFEKASRCRVTFLSDVENKNVRYLVFILKRRYIFLFYKLFLEILLKSNKAFCVFFPTYKTVMRKFREGCFNFLVCTFICQINIISTG